MKQGFWILALFLGFVAQAQTQSIATISPNYDNSKPNTATQRLAEKHDSQGPLSESIWGFYAVTASGKSLVNIRANKRFVPASNIKLLTTGAALLSLGSNYTYKTTLATDGPVLDSVLQGNLHIIGGGDPLLGNRYSYLPKAEDTFQKWDKILEDNGIKSINGDIIADGSFFSSENQHDDWNVGDVRYKYGVVPSGLCWRGTKNDSIPDGPYAAALHYLEWLCDSTSCGVTVSGSVIENSSCSDSLFVLGEVESEPLRSLIETCLHWSDNYIAETLIKTLGKHYSGSDDYKSSTTALHLVLDSLNLCSDQMLFVDGSGLSRKNYVSPEFFVNYLLAMQDSKVSRDFVYSLPYMGEKHSTLEPRMLSVPLGVKSRIRAKSGSLNGVFCMSGYILSPSGNTSETIVFSLLTNNSVASKSKVSVVIEELLLSLTQE